MQGNDLGTDVDNYTNVDTDVCVYGDVTEDDNVAETVHQNSNPSESSIDSDGNDCNDNTVVTVISCQLQLLSESNVPEITFMHLDNVEQFISERKTKKRLNNMLLLCNYRAA